ncbi:hypothetical protein [Streptomyces sp. enrichment culture]|uniref:hypothetical protein n=1 Tax=Streptomyces sp. enrichment culture TaxID=1795815 RepID=UPI003F546403
MTRTKKYAAAAAVAAVLVGIPTGAYATHATAPSAPAPTAATRTAPTTPNSTAAEGPAAERPSTQRPTVVRPGERVDAGGGWTLWLTRDGKHWAGPDGYENFRSVTDGNIDLGRPGVSHQSEGDATGVFHSGVYYGTKKAARVELVAADGTRTRAALVELPGKPGWGAWYVSTPPATDPGGIGVALYDRTGRLLAELPARPF